MTGVAIGLALLASTVGLDEMRRIVDRAFTAELGGDLPGAEAAVLEVLETSTVTGSARIRAEDYLEGLTARRRAFAVQGRTRAGFAEAFGTLRASPRPWADAMWRRAEAALPELRGPSAALGVRVEGRRIAGADRDAVVAGVVERLQAEGLRAVGEGGARLRFDLDASDVTEERHRQRARAEASYVLRGPDRSLLGRGTADEEARRSEPEVARRWAVRRALDDLVAQVVFDLRLAWLRGDVSP